MYNFLFTSFTLSGQDCKLIRFPFYFLRCKVLYWKNAMFVKDVHQKLMYINKNQVKEQDMCTQPPQKNLLV